MLTNGLEKAIQSGLAQYKTFQLGASGVGRIPCPKNQFLIIIDFDYWHFIDPPEPAVIGNPAVSSSTLDGGVAIFQADIQAIPGGPSSGAITFDPTNAATQAQTYTDIQNYLNVAWPGFTVTGGFALGIWTVNITTTAPGAIYNGLTPGYFTAVPVLAGPYAGGTPNVTSLENLLANATHQLEFRSTKSRNHFIIRENVQVFPATMAGGIGFWNVNGFYHRDVYLVHTESVQMNISRVPSPDNWTTNYSALPEKSQEFSLPVGYGQGILSAVRRVDFGGAGADGYEPLTSEFEDLPGTAPQEQFKVNIQAGRELSDPTVILNPEANNGDRNYPLVNVGYVLINKKYSDFVKSS